MPPQESPTKFFIYARKSSESEDQQVASIDSQIRELRAIAERDRLDVVDVLSESQSAKAPGRPIFNEMLKRVSRGDAGGILCWKLDRLARNPVDGGNISWMLQQGVIQRIQTHERVYCPADNVLMMSVELGMANQFIRELSVNTKRGLKAKAEKGWYPGVAKPGYLNEWHREKGERTTPKDPLRFPLIRRALKLVLKGTCSPPQILNRLNNEWGYRTTKRKRIGGTPMAHSTFYRILNDPFYYGVFEYPRDSGNWHQGKHMPMITKEEFWRIQKLLGGKGRPRPKKHTFAFTGLITCGECGAAVTAEVKEQVICSVCKKKFSSKNRAACPKCGTAIDDMRSPKHLRYEYYHCTKRKKTPCSQGAVEVIKLEAQISDVLQDLTIPERLKDWFLKQIEAHVRQEVEDRAPVIEAIQEALENNRKRLDNLLKLKISPQNGAGELLSDEEFASQKANIAREMQQLEQKLTGTDTAQTPWIEACAHVFNFVCYAYTHFQKGDASTKRMILSALGSNLTLSDKNLRISLHKCFHFIHQIQNTVPALKPGFEPKNSRQPKEKNRAFNPVSPIWLPGSDSNRRPIG